MDYLAGRRRSGDVGLHLPRVFSLGLTVDALAGCAGSERAVRFGQHHAAAGDIAAIVDEVRVGIERRGKTNRVGSPCVAQRILIRGRSVAEESRRPAREPRDRNKGLRSDRSRPQ